MRWISCLLLLCWVLPVCGQSTLQRRPEQPPDYVLGPGDQVVVHVADMDDLPQTPLRIDPGGSIDLPMVGRVQASGLTMDQLRAELTSRLTKYIHTPDVTINLSATESRPVSVVGEVTNPGVHQLLGTTRLLDVLSFSGGLKTDAGPDVLVTRKGAWGHIDRADATVDSATGDSTASIPLDNLMKLKTPEDNIVVHPGDVVSVPRGELIYVLGDVRKAGGFILSEHRTMPLLQALTMAEGLAPDSSASHARILRPSPGGDGPPKEINVDVTKIEKGQTSDVPLYANDVLYIPHSGIKATSRRAMEAAIGITSGLAIYR